MPINITRANLVDGIFRQESGYNDDLHTVVINHPLRLMPTVYTMIFVMYQYQKMQTINLPQSMD
jgi:hypothetical protein